MDIQIVRWCNQLAQRSTVWTLLSIFLATCLIWFLAIGVIIQVFFLPVPLWSNRFFVMALSGVIALAVSRGIGVMRFRARPFAIYDDIIPLVRRRAQEKSFPSDHASVAFAVITPVIPIIGPWIRLALIVGAVLIAVGRVLVGVHYATDVIAGAFIGALVWVIIEQLMFLSKFV